MSAVAGWEEKGRSEKSKIPRWRPVQAASTGKALHFYSFLHATLFMIPHPFTLPNNFNLLFK